MQSGSHAGGVAQGEPTLFMQTPTKPQEYSKAIEIIEQVRLETQSKGRDADLHRTAVQKLVELFNAWTELSKQVTDLSRQIAAIDNSKADNNPASIPGTGPAE